MRGKSTLWIYSYWNGVILTLPAKYKVLKKYQNVISNKKIKLRWILNLIILNKGRKKLLLTEVNDVYQNYYNFQNFMSSVLSIKCKMELFLKIYFDTCLIQKLAIPFLRKMAQGMTFFCYLIKHVWKQTNLCNKTEINDYLLLLL